jgi:hypothetical protein
MLVILQESGGRETVPIFDAYGREFVIWQPIEGSSGIALAAMDHRVVGNHMSVNRLMNSSLCGLGGPGTCSCGELHANSEQIIANWYLLLAMI